MSNSQPPNKLKKRYEEVYNNLRDTYESEVIEKCECKNAPCAPSHPYFISAPSKYWDAKAKVMIVGQETRGWYRHDGHEFMGEEPATVDQLIDHQVDGPRWGGTFKRGCDQLRKALPAAMGYEDSDICFLWNNVLKIGKHKGRGRACRSIIEW